jgi:hypothetical protein
MTQNSTRSIPTPLPIPRLTIPPLRPTPALLIRGKTPHITRTNTFLLTDYLAATQFLEQMAEARLRLISTRCLGCRESYWMREVGGRVWMADIGGPGT